jgi:hypothetical protein
MFPWRKRKPQEEESLVPHGLIWQATEEPMPPRAESSKPNAPPSATTITLSPQIPPAVKMPMGRVEAGATPPVNIGGLAPKLDEIPRPLPWASLNVKDAIKKPPVLDDASFWRTPARSANVTGISSVPNKSAPIEDKPEIKLSSPAKAINDRGTSRKTLPRVFVDCKRELSGALSEARHGVAELSANAKHAYAAWKVRRNITQARQGAEARIAHLRIDASRQKRAAVRKQNLSLRMTAVISGAQGVVSGMQEKAATVFEGSGQLVRRMSARRVRVRIAAGGELAIFFQRMKRTHGELRLALQRNSRLATSMTMAALSAVLALGLILLVSRSQPSASAGTRAVISPQQQRSSVPQPVHSEPSKSFASNSAQSAPLPAGNISSAKASAVVSTALRAPIKPSRSKAAAPRPHHNEDEDYVARDTYVYYGTKGKQSR